MNRWLLIFWTALLLPAPDALAQATGVRIKAVSGPVTVSRDGGVTWDAATPYREDGNGSSPLRPGDQLKTGPKGRAVLLLSDATTATIEERSTVVMPEPSRRTGLRFFEGLGYIFNREKPGQTEVRGKYSAAVIKGTELVFRVTENEDIVHIIDGLVELTNDFGGVEIASRQDGRASDGQAPIRTAALYSSVPEFIQWCLYYPAVLDPDDLVLEPAEAARFADVLALYRAGNLRAAAAAFESLPFTGARSERLIGAALDLAFARVREALARLEGLPRDGPARAIDWLVRAVQFRFATNELSGITDPSLTGSELLALSYARQSQRDLEGALSAAKAAVAKSPNFGFAWARKAELEFGFGDLPAMEGSLVRALALSPNNAQAAVLQGFILAARNRTAGAREAFERAIELDAWLGNAWLGRGLARIRMGDIAAGREDLQVAATLEPQRSFLRSYLAKAFAESGNSPKAAHELDLARELDPRDPTPWLYAALFHQNSGQVNDALRDLRRAEELNNNRAVYRSRFALDQDRAVRGARLASIYRDAGLPEAARQSASRSTESSYSNPSAHLFLAESYLSLERVNLRAETARVSEYLIANLLAPPGAGAWSPAISQQEYSSLLEREGLNFYSAIEIESSGRWSQSAALAGNWQGSSASVDGFIHEDPGYRPNNRLEIASASLQYRQQITPSDTLYLQPFWADYEFGDRVEHYDPASANPDIHFRESQEPILVGGWRHSWQPGNETVLLLTRLQDTLEVEDPTSFLPRVATLNGPREIVRRVRHDEYSRTDYEASGVELQQIVASRLGDTIVGVRWQSADLEARSRLAQNQPDGFFNLPETTFSLDGEAERLSAYAYQTWQVTPRFQLSGGLAFDSLSFPANFRTAPFDASEEQRDQISPKLGFSADLWRGASLRGGYLQGLGGVSFEQSFRIEPSQVAGISQAYRSVAPESVAGSLAGERFEKAGLEFSQFAGSNTWFSVSAEWLASEAGHNIGAFRASFPQLLPESLRQNLEYEEGTAQFTISQLVGRDFSFGAAYRISEAELNTSIATLPDAAARPAGLAQDSRAVLQQAKFFGAVNHPSGFFFRAEAVWTRQHLARDLDGLPGEEVWQGNLYAGSRFARRRAELAVALYNIGNTDYRLHPINLFAPMHRGRTLAASLKWRL